MLTFFYFGVELALQPSAYLPSQQIVLHKHNIYSLGECYHLRHKPIMIRLLPTLNVMVELSRRFHLFYFLLFILDILFFLYSLFFFLFIFFEVSVLLVTR